MKREKRRVQPGVPSAFAGQIDATSCLVPAGWLVDQLRQYLPSTPFTRSSAAGAAASDTDPMRRRLEQLRFQSETRAALDRRTRALVQTLRRAASEASQLQRIEDLCAHLAQHPHAKALCVKVRDKRVRRVGDRGERSADVLDLCARVNLNS